MTQHILDDVRETLVLWVMSRGKETFTLTGAVNYMLKQNCGNVYNSQIRILLEQLVDGGIINVEGYVYTLKI